MEKSRKARLRKPWKIAAFALAGLLFLAILAGAGAVLVTRRLLAGEKLREWVNDNPEKLYLAYANASSSWPGRVRVHGLRLRGRDPNVEWEFRIDDCLVNVSLPDLLRKKFHATAMDARGFVFRLRQRIPPGEVTAKRAEVLPPIEGFAPVPVRGRPPAEASGPASHLWSVQIDRLAADPVREIWVNAYRYLGAARLSGRLWLRPRVEASVGPAVLEWHSGELFLFGKRAMSPMAARIECRIDPFDPKKVRGSEVWDSISSRVRFRGDLAGLEFLDPLLGGEPVLSGGKGAMSGEIRLDDGKGEARIGLSAQGASAKYAKETLRGNLAAEFRMRPWRPARGVAETRGSFISLRDIGSGQSSDRTWWGRFDLGPSRLASVGHGLQLKGRVSARCRDARPLYTVFRVGLPKWTRGLMVLEDFSAQGAVDFAPRLLSVQDLEARGGRFEILGRYSRSGVAKEGAFLVTDPPLTVGVQIDGASTHVKLFGATKWFEEQSRKH
jgi:hypothetical protein